MDDQSSGEWRAPARERFGNRLTIYGLPLLTDRWGIGALFEDMEAEFTDEDRLETARFCNDPNYEPKPRDPQKLVNRIDEFYPGLQQAVIRGMRELANQNVPAGHVVFLNGKVQVWPREQFSVPPSDFYPTEVTPASPGYEAVVLEREAALTAKVEVIHEAALDDAFLTELGRDARALLKNVRMMAVSCDATGCTSTSAERMIQLVRKHLVPWAKANAANDALLRETLDGYLWVLGREYLDG